MLENILVFIFISVLVFSSNKKRAVGWLVFCYYAIYILIELDFFGYTSGNIFTTPEKATIWYLIYTVISLLFLISFLILFLITRSTLIFFYSCWILFNMFISGLSSIFQAFETNAILIGYNFLQNINLFVDVIVVIIGTDNLISRSKRGTYIINSFRGYVNKWLWMAFNKSNEDK